jgi:K+ transporter
VVITKFFQGGWITIVVTGSLVGVMFLIKHHYNNTRKLLNRLDELGLAAAVDEVETPAEIITDIKEEKVDFNAATAVFLVNGYNGIGLHTLFGAFKLFGNTTFKNYVFVQVGVVDAGNFKGASEVEKLRTITQSELERYVDFMHKQGYYSEYFYSIGTDIIEEITQLLPKVIEKYPKAIFFGGQLVFPEDTYFTRWLHNYIVFVLQKKLYQQGMPLIIMPIKVY